ncbi:unnamed protein product, partial [Amoebophrya sp. A25]
SPKRQKLESADELTQEKQQAAQLELDHESSRKWQKGEERKKIIFAFSRFVGSINGGLNLKPPWYLEKTLAEIADEERNSAFDKAAEDFSHDEAEELDPDPYFVPANTRNS